MSRATSTSVTRQLWSRKRRLAGCGLAVVIGVAFLAATLVFGDAMSTGVERLFAEGNASTDVLVRNATELGSGEVTRRGTLPASIVDELRAVDGVAAAAGVVDGIAQIDDAHGEPVGGEGPPTIGTTWIDDPALQTFVVVDGRPPAQPAPAAPVEVAIDSGTARTADLHVGDLTTVRVPEVVDVQIVGIVELPSGASMGGVTFTLFPAGVASQLLLGEDAAVTSVAVRAADDVAPDELRERIATMLPPSAEALTGGELTAEQTAGLEDDFLGFFRTFLLVFAGVALLVATFSIHNTFSILVAQRTRESALLRALGASRGQILASVVAEGAVVGVLASAIGLGAGVALAHGLDAILDAVGFGVPTASLTPATSTVVTALVVGTTVTLVASLAPAWKAGRTPPVAALRDVAVDRSGASRWRGVAGVVIAAAGAAIVVTATSRPSSALALAGLGALVTLIGTVVLGPVVARAAAGVIGAPIAATRGHSGRLARRNAMRNPRRTAGTASALMIGTAVVALFATFGASLRASLDDMVRSSFGGDLVVAQEGFSGAGLDPRLADAIAAVPGVRAVAALGNAAVRLDGRSEDPAVADLDELAAVADLRVLDGTFGDASGDSIAVSRAYAAQHGWSVGTVVPIEFVDGTAGTVTVAAVYGERNIVGDVIMSAAAWAPHAGRTSDVAVLIDLAEGIELADGRAAVEAVTQRFDAPAPQDRDEFVESASEGTEQMLSLVYGLLGLAIVIALLGIANTLSLSIHERTRELGLLRAVGQTRAQLRSTVRWESVIIAVFGTIGGLALGTLLGWGVMRAMKAQEEIGTFEAPVATLAVVLGVSVVCGVLAAVRPARRAAKLDILAAVAAS